MTARIPENVSTWLVDWSIVAIMGIPMTTMMRRRRTKTTTPNQMTTSSRRSSENPTNCPHGQ
jgi:hypothetical protein